KPRNPSSRLVVNSPGLTSDQLWEVRFRHRTAAEVRAALVHPRTAFGSARRRVRTPRRLTNSSTCHAQIAVISPTKKAKETTAASVETLKESGRVMTAVAASAARNAPNSVSFRHAVSVSSAAERLHRLPITIAVKAATTAAPRTFPTIISPVPCEQRSRHPARGTDRARNPRLGAEEGTLDSCTSGRPSTDPARWLWIQNARHRSALTPPQAALPDLIAMHPAAHSVSGNGAGRAFNGGLRWSRTPHQIFRGDHLMPCTTLLVGRNASADGSPLVARTEDSSNGTFDPKRVVVVRPEDQPRTYTSVIGWRTIELPAEPLRYTSSPNALPEEGNRGCAGVNAANVAMSATETITSNPRVLGADPLVEHVPATGEPGTPGHRPEQPGGFGEEDFVTLVLPYIRSAREGVQRLGALLAEHGTYE